MTAHLIDGKACAATIRARLKEHSLHFEHKTGRRPGLAVVVVGEDPASQIYVRNKGRAARSTGLESSEYRLASTASEQDILDVIHHLNEDDSLDGILLQLPVPRGVDAQKLIAALNPLKDVDGLTPENQGRLMLGKPGLRPCTPTGCVLLAEHVLGDITGQHVVILGRSVLVGKPAALLFLEKNCTVSLAHSKTRDVASLVRGADIVVAAVGRPGLVRGDWVKSGACLLDVGINRLPPDPQNPDGRPKLVGDIAFEEASQHAGFITPVPGGVGPMTIACLLQNTLYAAYARAGFRLPSF